MGFIIPNFKFNCTALVLFFFNQLWMIVAGIT